MDDLSRAEFGPVTLEGERVRLVPLTPAHREDLAEAVKDGELWKLWYTSVPAPDEVEAEIERRMALQRAGTMIPFAVLDAVSGQAIGMTTYMNVDRVNRRVEIGSTWYAQRFQRTGLNTEAKLLLMGYAFERLQCIAVELRTHVKNAQSRRAIERLGAKLDGILRQHAFIRDGSIRDVCVYSVIAEEWVEVKERLRGMLG